MSPPDDGDREPSDSPPSDAPGDSPSDSPGDSPSNSPGDSPSDSPGDSSPDAPGDSPPRETADDRDQSTDGDVGARDSPADDRVGDRSDDELSASGSDPATAGGHPGDAESGGSREVPETDSDRPRRLDEGNGDEVEEKSEEEDGTDWRVFVYDIVNSAVAVLLVGALLFAVSGVWPPMVAVESPSMTPQMKTGDLVFVMEETRFPGEGAQAGVVTARVGDTTDADYRKFGRQGDVIVYNPDGNNDTTPIIHRAMFWVNESENWYDKADKQAVGRYSACGNSTGEALPNCPAPHSGFITKGDANGRYDQVDQLSGPVRPAWVVGTAEVRIPLLGCIRLRSERCANGVFGTVAPGAPPGCERCRVSVGG